MFELLRRQWSSSPEAEGVNKMNVLLLICWVAVSENGHVIDNKDKALCYVSFAKKMITAIDNKQFLLSVLIVSIGSLLIIKRSPLS